MKFTHEQLMEKGYRLQPNGEWTRPHAKHSRIIDVILKEQVIDKPREPLSKVQKTNTAHLSKQRSEPKPKRMTQCELRWYWHLNTQHPDATIIPQFRLRVGQWNAPRPVHYTADFAVFAQDYPNTGVEWSCVLWEVKDKRRKAHSDELTRPKMVRAHNPFVSAVWLAEWDGERWTERRLA